MSASCESAPQVGHCVQTEAQICSVVSSSFIFIMCCVSLNEDEHVHSLQPQSLPARSDYSRAGDGAATVVAVKLLQSVNKPWS